MPNGMLITGPFLVLGDVEADRRGVEVPTCQKLVIHVNYVSDIENIPFEAPLLGPFSLVFVTYDRTATRTACE